MNKKFCLILISLLLSANFANAVHYGLTTPDDYTGGSIIGKPSMLSKTSPKQTEIFITEEEEFAERVSNKDDGKHTMPPIKKLRLKYREKYKQIFTTATETPVNFLEAKDDEITVDENGDIVIIEKKEKKDKKDKKLKKSKKAQQEQNNIKVNNENKNSEKTATLVQNKTVEKPVKKPVVKKEEAKVQKSTAKLKDRLKMDCDTIDYDTETATIKARGNVKIYLPEQGVALYANDIEYDKVANIIRANDKVVIRKGDLKVTGDYIVIDLNEENILLARPISNYNQMEINAKQANMHEGVISQEDGSIVFKRSSMFKFRSGKRGPRMEQMMTKKDKKLSQDIAEGRYKIKATKIVIDSQKEHDTFLIQKATVYKDGKKKFTIPRTKFYTNKNHDYTQGDFFELGSKRDAGLFFGPGVVFKLPKGAALKAVPFVSYKSEFGYGGLLRFNSGTNETYLLYGSQRDKFIGRGRQDLDDNLYIEYATNDYMNEWFMGRMRPKYGIALAYDKQYVQKDFFGPTRNFKFRHRMTGGFYEDIDYDKYNRKLKGRGEEDFRVKYMMEGTQTIWNKVNRNELTCLRLDLIGQVSTAVYGNGNTQVIGRVGPRFHSQYKNWMQDIGYFQSAFDDNTPMPVFDKYRYGKSNAYIRETFKLHRNFALSWFGSMTLSDDTYNNKMFQENSFYVTLGPEELNVNVGYDFVRENIYFTLAAALDPKGTEIMYDKLEIKNADKFGKKKDNTPKETSVYNRPTKKPVLRNAIVQEIRT